MNPVVDRPAQAVHVAVGDAEREAVVDHFSQVGPTIAVAVLEIKDLRRRGHEDATLPRCHRGREAQAVGEHRARVGPAVPIAVFEQADVPSRPAIGRQALWVVAHGVQPHSSSTGGGPPTI